MPRCLVGFANAVLTRTRVGTSLAAVHPPRAISDICHEPPSRRCTQPGSTHTSDFWAWCARGRKNQATRPGKGASLSQRRARRASRAKSWRGAGSGRACRCLARALLHRRDARSIDACRWEHDHGLLECSTERCLSRVALMHAQPHGCTRHWITATHRSESPITSP